MRILAIVGGTGKIGSALALRLARAGEQTIVGSRDEARAVKAAESIKRVLGEEAPIMGMTNEEAVVRSDIVILTVPLGAQIATIKSLKGSLREGQIFVDATNILSSAIGGDWTKPVGLWHGSAAEQALSLLPPGVRVVSAFKNVRANELKEIKRDVNSDIFVCGDDADSKGVVMDLVRKIPNARPIDAGPLENSRLVEYSTCLFLYLSERYEVPYVGLRLTGPEGSRIGGEFSAPSRPPTIGD